uniref:Uncharacterized protein n=1 Tax=Acrobeloides nanus TaxID=290746 RepID=A0A914EQL4_9BILA
MRAHFRYHCQPSKPLRLDLVEFCKDYSDYCNVINYHRLPGPGLGPPKLRADQGHVGVNGNFGFGIGVVPGLEIDAGWGVDVGPLPFGDSIGVGVGLDLGILGATQPEKFRRGMDSPNDPRGGIVGINGGVGVDAGGVPVGVNTGL